MPKTLKKKCLLYITIYKNNYLNQVFLKLIYYMNFINKKLFYKTFIHQNKIKLVKLI